MTGVTHQLVAIVSAFWLLLLFPHSVGLIVGIMAVIAVMVGALTPDLDHPTANIWRRMLGGWAIGEIFQAFSGGHRHITHSIIGIVGIGYLFWLGIHKFIQPEYIPSTVVVWKAFMIGYISHPIADTLTDRGVPWLLPLSWSIKIPPGPEELRVTTGSFVETLLLRGALLVVLAFLIYGHWPTLLNFFR